MKATTLKLGFIAFAIFSFSLTTQAQEKKKWDLDTFYKSFDKNNDGSITLEEFTSKKRKKEVPVENLKKNYARIDADSNGSVTLEEFKTAMAKAKAKRKEKGKKKN